MPRASAHSAMATSASAEASPVNAPDPIMRPARRRRRPSSRDRAAGALPRAVRLDDDHDRQAELPRELEVALVVGGHRHDGAGAVLAEDEVGDPDRHRLAGERVQGEPARGEAVLLDLAADPGRPILSTEPGGLLPESGRVGRPGGQLLHQFVLGREQHEARPVDRVDAGGKDLDVHRSRTRTGRGRRAAGTSRAPLPTGRSSSAASSGPCRASRSAARSRRAALARSR